MKRVRSASAILNTFHSPSVDTAGQPYNSPRFGSLSSVSLVVTAEEANGEVGFADVREIAVREPEGADLALRVPLKVFREGTNGEATVYWSVRGTGENAGHVTEGDTGPTVGSVVMAPGELLSFLLKFYMTEMRAFCLRSYPEARISSFYEGVKHKVCVKPS